MSEALKKELIEECKRLDASYNPPLNHSIDEVRSDSKLIKSVHEEKRKREVFIEEYKCHVLLLTLPFRASSDRCCCTLPLMLSTQRVSMHDLKEALHSQHYV